ncbi:phytochelatin synthase family protein [Kiloniella laminariae]|uniref:phytochelatin synthase family protein n=1 Tax=Kiloniella laminariae TaxID=454162 RepID=UPI0003A85714|nr:phytochelatin synthase family protein [Kiloniella laminariae]
MRRASVFLSLLLSTSFTVSLSGSLVAPALADDLAPKLGEFAVPMTADTAFLRSANAPDYWAFSPYVKPQFTSSACSIATVTATLNGLRGLPPHAEDTVTTQPALLELVADPVWSAVSAEDGDGVTFAQLEEFSRKAVEALAQQDARLANWQVASWKPAANDAAALASLREKLAKNEASAGDALMIYFNQGVLTGDWDGPHISLIGAYDAASDRVLILEVDQEWYIPYWSPVPKLLEAMVKPTSAEHGVLEGQAGGFVSVSKL